MAKPTKRHREPIKKVDVLNLPLGIYLDEKGFGEIHLLHAHRSPNGEPEVMYEGKVHKGELALVTGKNLELQVPTQGFNHGYTIEGFAQQLFLVENACVSYNAKEDRTFAYINPTSKLVFTGNPDKKYKIYFHIYENCIGKDNNRWVVINAEEA